MATQRLTEEDVHTACSEISIQGERPTSLTLLDKIGRGSLTTITKYLNTWQDSDEAQAINIDLLPVVVKLPDELAKEGEDLIKKVWNIAKGIADKELDIQREALKQAEAINQLKVEEAFKFSEAQAVKIEQLNDALMSMKNQLDEKHLEYRQATNDLNISEKNNVGLNKDNEQVKSEVRLLQQQISTLEDNNNKLAEEKGAAEKESFALSQQKDAELKALEINLVKVNEILLASKSTNEKLTLDMTNKSSECGTFALELQSLITNHSNTVSELKIVKQEVQVSNEKALSAMKEVEHLRGQLEVFKLFKSNREEQQK